MLGCSLVVITSLVVSAIALAIATLAISSNSQAIQHGEGASMNRFRQSWLILTSLYLLYLLKWAVGIDIFPNHHAPKIVKFPALAVIYSVNKLGAAVSIPDHNPHSMNQDMMS